VWDVRVSPTVVSASAQLALEQSLLAQCASMDRMHLAILWQSEPALVVSQTDRNLPQFAEAVRCAAAEGWPVSVRSTGGTAVALVPGVVNVGLIAPWRATRPSLEQGFELVCAPLITALARFGVTASIGSAPQAFCDGRFNVLVGARKIAGTSQRHASQGAGGALLIHAAVLVDADPASLTAVVARFYDRAGRATHLDATTVTSLSQCVSHPGAGDLPRKFVATLSDVLTQKAGNIRSLSTCRSRKSHPRDSRDEAESAHRPTR